MAPTSPITVLDLFAGAGGLSAGLHSASDRFETVRAVEMDPFAAASYDATFGAGSTFAGPIERWLEQEDVPEVDLVVGGPPCQGFSTLGKQDEEDERNFLWEKYAETVLRARPKYFVVENVAAFAQSRQYRDFVAATEPSGILRDYTFDSQVLNAADYGAPQARRRAVLIGRRRDQQVIGFPEPTHVGAHVSVAEAFRGIPTEPDGDADFSERTVEVAGKKAPGAFTPRELHIGRQYTRLSIERFQAIPPGGNRFDLPDHLLARCWRNHRQGSGDVMGRLHADKPSVTIRTEFFKPEKGRYLHPTAMRAITHYEAAVLQGFPNQHQFVGSRAAIARQIGNAVPIPLGAAIGRHIAAAI